MVTPRRDRTDTPADPNSGRLVGCLVGDNPHDAALTVKAIHPVDEPRRIALKLDTVPLPSRVGIEANGAKVRKHFCSVERIMI